MQLSCVTAFVKKMGVYLICTQLKKLTQWQYLSKEEKCKTLYQILPTLKVSKFHTNTCLQFIYI
jgi:drug/metabolite transporter superfamily protein YnfA